MFGVNIQKAIVNLGITAEEANSLDVYNNGKQDEQIESSVFSQAQSLLSQAKFQSRTSDYNTFWNTVKNNPLAQCLQTTLQKIFSSSSNSKFKFQNSEVEESKNKIKTALKEMGLNYTEFSNINGVITVQIHNTTVRANNAEDIISQIEKFVNECKKTDKGMLYSIEADGYAFVLTPQKETKNAPLPTKMFLEIMGTDKEHYFIYKDLLSKGEALTDGEKTFISNYQNQINKKKDLLQEYGITVDETGNIAYKSSSL